MKMQYTIIIFIFISIFIIPNMLISQVFGESNWNNSQIISTESNANAYRAILAVDQYETVHIAWRDKTNYKESGNDWDIFYKSKSKDGNWTLSEIVSTESIEDSNCLAMVLDEIANVHITWKDKTNLSDSGDDFDIFYKMKPKDGDWTTTEIVSTESSDDCGCPSIDVDIDSNIHIVWPDEMDYIGSGFDFDIFYKMKSKEGMWKTVEIVSNEGTHNSLKPSIIVDVDEIIHVVWEEQTDFANSGSDYDIFYKKKPKDGNWTTTDVVSTESTKNSLNPSFLTIDNLGTLHLAWVDQTDYNGAGSDYDIFYKKKPKDGNWTTTEVVSTESGSYSNWPSVFVDQNETVHIVWTDLSDFSKNYDVFYKKKPKDGNWTTAEIVSTESNFNSHFTSLSVDINGFIHVSWWDETSTKWVVYYNSKNPNNNQSIIDNEVPDNNDKTNETPAFNVILFFCALLVVFILNRRKTIKK